MIKKISAEILNDIAQGRVPATNSVHEAILKQPSEGERQEFEKRKRQRIENAEYAKTHPTPLTSPRVKEKLVYGNMVKTEPGYLLVRVGFDNDENRNPEYREVVCVATDKNDLPTWAGSTAA